MDDFMTKDPSISNTWSAAGYNPVEDLENLKRYAIGKPQLKTLHVPAICKVC